MSACKKCGSQSTTFKEGTSKKTGKPWKAYACDDCKEMNWVQSFPAKSTNFGTQSQVPVSNPLDEILKRVKHIESMLAENFGTKESVEEETTPF